jgi:hypothetical protein
VRGRVLTEPVISDTSRFVNHAALFGRRASEGSEDPWEGIGIRHLKFAGISASLIFGKAEFPDGLSIDSQASFSYKRLTNLSIELTQPVAYALVTGDLNLWFIGEGPPLGHVANQTELRSEGRSPRSEAGDHLPH